MQASSIWAGEYYAWSYNRPKSIFPHNGKKVKALATRRRRLYGNERLSTEVQVQYESNEPKWVPAREIVDFWDNYESELQHHQEAARTKQAAQDHERQQAIAAYEKKYADFATLTGIPRQHIEHIGNVVTINKAALLERLGVHEA